MSKRQLALLVLIVLTTLPVMVAAQSANERGDGANEAIPLQFSDDGTSSLDRPQQQPLQIERESTPEPEQTTAPAITPLESSQLLEQIKLDLRRETQNLQKTAQEISALELKLNQANERAVSLEEQIATIQAQINLNQTKVEFLEKQIAKLIKEIADLNEQIEAKEEQIDAQKELAQEYLELLYVHNLDIGTFDSSLSQSVKLLFAEDDADVLLNDLYYGELLEEARRRAIDELAAAVKQLERTQSKRQDSLDLQEEAQRERLTQQRVLEAQQVGLEELLAETQGEEDLYRQLIEQSKASQSAVRSEIAALQANYDEVIAQLGPGTAEEEGQLGPLNSDLKLSWPVNPSNGVSAFFRDPSYRAVIGLEHNAIDIRASMATPLKAPAEGVVYKLKGGAGTDYHYIIIAHRDGIMTLYGHVFEVLVDVGETVQRGQIIGLSGGAPGTTGAGPLTTGPHLHFEVFKDGVHVDPMLYLDLNGIDRKYIPDRYL